MVNCDQVRTIERERLRELAKEFAVSSELGLSLDIHNASKSQKAFLLAKSNLMILPIFPIDWISAQAKIVFFVQLGQQPEPLLVEGFTICDPKFLMRFNAQTSMK